jgi:hypothetical protein
MPHYLISGYRPDDSDPSTQDEAMMEEIMEEIHALNREMIAAGVRKFAGGLGPASTLRPQPKGEVLLTDGPYLETKEHIGGFWILECADLDEALAWVRKCAKACRAPMEVQEIGFMPAPNEAKRTVVVACQVLQAVGEVVDSE